VHVDRCGAGVVAQHTHAVRAGLVGAAWVAGSSLWAAVTVLRVVAIGGALLCVAAGLRIAADRGTFVRLAALSPLVLVHVVSGAHNDVLLAGLVVTGLSLAARPLQSSAFQGVLNVAAAGAAFGLASGVKITAVAAAPFAVPLLLKEDRRFARVLAVSGGIGVAVVITYTLMSVLTKHGLGFVKALDATGSMVQWLSLPTGVGMAIGYALRMTGQGPETFGAAVSVARTAGLVALVLVLVGLWWWTVRRPRERSEVLVAAGLGLLATAVLGPTFYAWYAIGGLVVLAAAVPAGPGRLRTAVTVAAGGLIFLTLPDSLGLATKTKVPGALLDVALLVALVAWTVRRRSSESRR
jgi:cbb3-type cytochrome oxidase subunit 3